MLAAAFLEGADVRGGQMSGHLASWRRPGTALSAPSLLTKSRRDDSLGPVGLRDARPETEKGRKNADVRSVRPHRRRSDAARRRPRHVRAPGN